MDGRDDLDMRRLYYRNAPSVDGGETWEAIRERVAARPRGARRRGRGMRLAVACSAVLIAAGAVSLGAYELVDHLRTPREVLVIGGDQELSPAAGGSLSVVGPDGETVLLTGKKAELYMEVQRIKQGLAEGTLVYDPAALNNVSSNGLLSLSDDPLVLLGGLQATVFASDMTVYLLTEATEEQISAVRSEIETMPEVRVYEFLSKEEALERLKSLFADRPEIFSGLSGNPLPASFDIWLVDGQQPGRLLDSLLALPGVDQVTDLTGSYWLTTDWLTVLRTVFVPAGADASPAEQPATSGGATSAIYGM